MIHLRAVLGPEVPGRSKRILYEKYTSKPTCADGAHSLKDNFQPASIKLFVQKCREIKWAQ